MRFENKSYYSDKLSAEQLRQYYQTAPLRIKQYLNLSYREYFNQLKERGLKKVNLTISDEHKGLLKAQQEAFPGTTSSKMYLSLYA